MTRRHYETAAGFRVALETRLRRASVSTGKAPARQRQLLIFDRLLARIVATLKNRVIVKGGVALEIRLSRARATRDVDLRLTGNPTQLLAELQEAALLDLGDFLSFTVMPDARHGQIAGEGVIYEGQRFRVTAMLAGRRYGEPFGLDASFSDALLSPPEFVEGTDWLGFIGIARTRLPLYPKESHIAEKLHAYTLPRPYGNTRIRDLPDLALLAMTGAFQASALEKALEKTFSFRKTHRVPASLPTPPEEWATAYERMAAQNALPWSTLAAVTVAAASFLDPVLRGETGEWSPEAWAWIRLP